MKFTRTQRALGIIGLATLALIASPGLPSVGADSSRTATVSAPLADGLAGPLQIAVDGDRVLVGQAFSGTVSLVTRDGTKDLFSDPGAEGVAFGPFGSIIYTYSDFEAGVKEIRLRTRSGQTKTIADLAAYEATTNPDQGNRYGLFGISDECAALFPPDAGLAPYNGGIDSHPYALKAVPGGVLVAEAAGNDILFVSWWGTVRTVAVLPPQPPVVVTAEAAAANELPPCVVGSSFVAEPVPTDIEIGPRGALYVSTLPGGPEDPSLGARGSVYRVNPWNGTSTLVASGFAGATNLAISPAGTVYVSELFGGQVSRIVGDRGVPVASVDSPAALEWANGKLYVGTEAFGSGKIVTITP